MSGNVPILVLFASTSGSTREVAQAIVSHLGADRTEIADIGRLDAVPDPGGRRLVILATPTYGIGDWHSAWAEKGEKIAAALEPHSAVALLCLADSRGHGRSFAGGLARLHSLVEKRGCSPIGSVPAQSYSFIESPALHGERFPGLVLEYRRNRHAACQQVRHWLDSLLSAIAAPAH